ncbi:MAG: AAA family ATPase [Pseudomonadota bacterium]
MTRWIETPWSGWYGLAVWKKRRAEHIEDHPLCVYCLRSGVINDGSKRMTGAPQDNPKRCFLVADHVTPHRGDWDQFIAGELQTLCPDHHDIVKRGEEQAGYSKVVGLDGFPVDPKHPANGDGVDRAAKVAKTVPRDLARPSPSVTLTIVMGPPGAGKTTYGRTQCDDGKLIDLDLIANELAPDHCGVRDTSLVRQALQHRNMMLRDLANASGRWSFVVGAPSVEERRLWIDQLTPARAVYMATAHAECERRAASDANRTLSDKVQRDIIRAFFQRAEPILDSEPIDIIEG